MNMQHMNNEANDSHGQIDDADDDMNVNEYQQ